MMSGHWLGHRVEGGRTMEFVKNRVGGMNRNYKAKVRGRGVLLTQEDSSLCCSFFDSIIQ